MPPFWYEDARIIYSLIVKKAEAQDQCGAGKDNQSRALFGFGFWWRRKPSKDFFELRWNRHLRVCRDKPLARRLREARVFLSELLIILFASRSDPPPLKWSDLRYAFDIQEDCNGKEAIQA